MMNRKPAALARLTERRRTLEIACFLRRQLLRLTDAGIELIDHRIADLWRGARDRAEASEAGQLRRYRCMVADAVFSTMSSCRQRSCGSGCGR
jgi:hypothetical protein